MELDERHDRLGDLAEVMLRTVPLLYRQVIKKNEALEGSIMAYPKIGVLVILKNDGPLPLSVLAQRLSYSRQNLTSLTDRLENDDLVKRTPDSKDRRVINLELTDRGRQCLRELGERMRQRLVKELESMDDQDVASLRDSFDNIARIYLKVTRAESGPK